MARRLYSLLLYLLLPAAASWFWWRGRRTPAHRGSLRERLALDLRARHDAPLWLHAASIGELRALSTLLPALAESGPLLVTVGTPAGLTRAREKFADDARISTQAAPWDLPGAVRRFLDAVRPRGAVFIETELWPNLIHDVQQRGIPLTLVSARLSARSLRRYGRFAASLIRSTVRAFAAIGAQSEADRARFIALGAAPERVSVTGNLKFDQPADAGMTGRGTALRARWGPHRWMWVAGSTHAEEEDILLDAHVRLQQPARQRGDTVPVLALAPRRPERFDAVSRWLDTRGVAHARSSAVLADGTPFEPGEFSVILIDEMGVLPDWYAAGDAAFVGGSLVPVGGHNLLEPALLGMPVLTGPQVFNAPEVARALIEAGGAVVVNDAAQLVRQLEAWRADAEGGLDCGARAAAAVAAHRGAAARALDLIRASAASSAPSASG